MLHNFTLTLQPLWNSQVLNDLLSSSGGFKECRYSESSCEALYRILATVCHKNYAIVTYPSVQLMVILILHMCPPYSQHRINLVHSQNHSRGKSDGVHPYGCTCVWEGECGKRLNVCKGVCYLSGLLTRPIYGLYWMQLGDLDVYKFERIQ